MTTAYLTTTPVPQSFETGNSALKAFFTDVGFGLRSAMRTPFPLVTGIFIPLFFNLMFSWLQGDQMIDGVPGVNRTSATIMVFVIATAGYFNMVMGITQAREKGLLKRVRQTPASRTLHLLSRIAVAMIMAGASILLMVAVSMLGFGLEIRPMALPGLLLAFVLASIASASLGIALTRVIPTLEGALVIGTATLFPILFISGVFFPLEGMPSAVTTVTDLLPFAPMNTLIQGLLDPAATGLAIDVRSLVVVAAWAVIGMFCAVRFLKWEPRK